MKEQPESPMPLVSGEEFAALKWNDTGEDGDVLAHEIEWIPATKRHITDGVRPCWCGPSIQDGVIVHNTDKDNLN